MYVCVHACMYASMYLIYACMYVCMYACMHACVYVCMCVCVRVCECVCVYTYAQHLSFVQQLQKAQSYTLLRIQAYLDARVHPGRPP